MRSNPIVTRITLPDTKNKRRSAARRTLGVAVDVLDGERVHFGVVRNLSAGGMFLEGDVPHGIGAALHVRFQLPGDVRWMLIAAEVRWVRELPTPRGLGLRFVRIKPRDLERLLEFVHVQEASRRQDA